MEAANYASLHYLQEISLDKMRNGFCSPDFRCNTVTCLCKAITSYADPQRLPKGNNCQIDMLKL